MSNDASHHKASHNKTAHYQSLHHRSTSSTQPHTRTDQSIADARNRPSRARHAMRHHKQTTEYRTAYRTLRISVVILVVTLLIAICVICVIRLNTLSLFNGSNPNSTAHTTVSSAESQQSQRNIHAAPESTDTADTATSPDTTDTQTPATIPPSSTDLNITTVAEHFHLQPNDWRIVLVNREHPTAEMSPQLTSINSRCKVDARIADQTAQFLAAAQHIHAGEHLISCYRSVSYQAALFESYVQQTMAENPQLTRQQAQTTVMTYSQPAGTSEHQTGLAIDISSIELLNRQDPAITEKIQQVALQYGFVLRFPADRSTVTGIEYEDWHYRYVGPEIAQYMHTKGWALEDFVAHLNDPV